MNINVLTKPTCVTYLHIWHTLAILSVQCVTQNSFTCFFSLSVYLWPFTGQFITNRMKWICRFDTDVLVLTSHTAIWQLSASPAAYTGIHKAFTYTYSHSIRTSGPFILFRWRNQHLAKALSGIFNFFADVVKTSHWRKFAEYLRQFEVVADISNNGWYDVTRAMFDVAYISVEQIVRVQKANWHWRGN